VVNFADIWRLFRNGLPNSHCANLLLARNEVLGARVNLDMAAKKWDMVAALASHLVKVEPENVGW
jgi:hypothetical protein